MQHLDIGLVLSIEEGYALVASEYMHHGVPFVMTDVGASIEFSDGNPDCLIVAVDPVAIQAGIEELAHRMRFGSTSRRRLAEFARSRFSFERVAQAHVRYVMDKSVAARDAP
jgi:glycosyltransferase involved in cell wall biosynthesis